MTGFPPFTLTVYDADRQRKGTAGRPLQLSGAIRAGAPGDLTFSLDADDRRVKHLQADGARVRCDYRYGPSAPVLPLISGWVSQVSGGGSRRAARRTFTITDDWELFNDLLGWPNPAGTILQQGEETAYYTRKGPAETALKEVVAANVTRTGQQLTIPATQGRGDTVSLSYRMHSVAERAFPAVFDAGILPRVIQLGDELTLDVYVPVVRSRVLTQASGIVTDDSDFQLAPPRVTRITVGAGGEETARIFRQFIRTGWESQYGSPGKPYVRERFIDARDVGLEEGATALTADQEASLVQRADELFTQEGPRGSLVAKLVESPRFRFGRTFMLGDLVSVQLNTSPVLTDYVREVQFSWDTTGRKIVPLVGNWTDSENDRILAAIAGTMRDVRDLQRST